MAGLKTILAVGDINPGGENTGRVTGEEIGKRQRQLANVLPMADLVMGNLECPITDSPVARAGQLANLKMPLAMAPLLGSFHGLALANNHILDYGVIGLQDTLGALDRLGVRHCGAGSDLEEASRAVIFDLGGLSVAMLAFTDRNWYGAGRTRPGTHFWRGRRSAAAIAALARAFDFVIVHLHQGYEFVRFPGPEELRIARRAADAGADLVLGHHAHALMGVKRLGHALVAYGLGNFIFDPRAFDARHAERVGRRAVFRFTVGRHYVADWDVLPCLSDDKGWPLPAPEAEAAGIRCQLQELSVVLADRRQALHSFRREAAATMVPHAVRSLRQLRRQEGWTAFWRRLRRLRRVDFAVLAAYLAQRRRERKRSLR
jgi:hypothetical protein